jgi:hypothetical protein
LALNDKEINLRVRIQRCRDFWLDPAFEPPKRFVDEVIEAALEFDVEKIRRNMSPGMAEMFLEDLQLALSRCAPEALAQLERRIIRSFESCPVGSRYWSALSAREYFILAGQPAEARAARVLREKGHDSNQSEEAIAASFLLMIELQGLSALDQYERVLAAGLQFIPADFEYVLGVPTAEDVDKLVEKYSVSTSREQYDLILLLSVHPHALGPKSWQWLSEISRQEDHDQRKVAFRTLANCDAKRFGRMLFEEGWSWSPTFDVWVNHFGTGALIATTAVLPFEQIVSRLAPWRLLEAARLRGEDASKVRLAAKVLGYLVTGVQTVVPDPGATLSVERHERRAFPFVVSVEPRAQVEEENDVFAGLRSEMDSEERLNARRLAAETASARVDEARRSGAALLLAEFDAEDILFLLQHASDLIDGWIAGYKDRSSEFQRRVLLAEHLFLAVCEVLLDHDPETGVQLWYALRDTVRTRFIGAAGLEEFLHMVFRAPDSEAVEALREELLDLRRCHTDEALFEIAVASCVNGKSNWLAEAIKADSQSDCSWRRRRSAVLKGFVLGNPVPGLDDWPAGEIETSYDGLLARSARYCRLEGCARHWWNAYLAANTVEDAYAFWILFMRSADRRAWVWMQNDISIREGTAINLARKLSHMELNSSELERSMKRNIENLRGQFLGLDIVNGIGPWIDGPRSR